MSTPFEFLNSTIKIAPGRRIVPESDYSKMLEANEIIDRAQQEARRIRDEAQQAYEARRLEGYRDGLAQANDEKAVFCFQVAQEYKDIIGAIEEKLAGLLAQLVRNILGDIGEDICFQAYVNRGLQELVNEERITIKVHPSRRGLIEKQLQTLKDSQLVKSQIIRVASDPTLELDQSTIETNSSIVVLDLQRQLEIVKKYASGRLDELSKHADTAFDINAGNPHTNHLKDTFAEHQNLDIDDDIKVLSTENPELAGLFQVNSENTENDLEEEPFRVFK